MFQEVGIAAVLSGDKANFYAVASGDPYLAFAKMAHLVPADATKQSHEKERERCKRCVLGTNYGMGVHTLAQWMHVNKAHSAADVTAVGADIPNIH